MEREGSEGEEISQEEIIRRQILIRRILHSVLTKDAYERLGRVKLANPDLYSQVVQILIHLYQTGQIKEKISDEKLVALLKKLRGPKRETRIRRV